jgi:hypothetical protein
VNGFTAWFAVALRSSKVVGDVLLWALLLAANIADVDPKTSRVASAILVLVSIFVLLARSPSRKKISQVAVYSRRQCNQFCYSLLGSALFFQREMFQEMDDTMTLMLARNKQ